MTTKGETTRETIMDAAEGLVLSQGFSATSVDSVIAAASITKGTFFYHFKAKADLADALLARYASRDAAHLDGDLARAKQLSRDPLQQVLILIGLFIEELEGLTEPFPGCLYASYCYESGLLDADTVGRIAGAMDYWRDTLRPMFEAIMVNHPPRFPAIADELTDMLLGLFEGAFILSRTYKDPGLVAAQLKHYRNYIELLFAEG